QAVERKDDLETHAVREQHVERPLQHLCCAGRSRRNVQFPALVRPGPDAERLQREELAVMQPGESAVKDRADGVGVARLTLWDRVHRRSGSCPGYRRQVVW